MSDLSRVEQLLRNAIGEDIYNVTPQSRVEILLAQLNELIEGKGGGSVSPEDIATAVAAYLDEHLTNPTNPPVDTSLAIAGAAADAKKAQGAGIMEAIQRLGYQMDQCCCSIKTQMLQDRLADAQADLVTANGQISNANQTQTILNTMGKWVANPAATTA